MSMIPDDRLARGLYWGRAWSLVAGVPAFVKQVEVDGRVSRDPSEWPADLRVRRLPPMLEEKQQ